MKYCGNCGKELNDEDKFCSNCSTEFLEFSFEAENTKKQNSFNVNKSKKKGIAIIISVVAIIVIATIGITVATQYDDLIASYNEAVDDIEKMNQEKDKEQENEESTGMQVQENTTSNADVLGSTDSNITETMTNKSQQLIDVFDLFESLEKAESLLGSETQPSKDVQAYTNHFFENVKIQCVYGTNKIYSVIVDYSEKGFSDSLKINGIDCNSNKSDWDNAFGDLFYSDYDSDGNRLFGYEYETNGKTYYIEFTVSSDKPEKIGIYYEDVEY